MSPKAFIWKEFKKEYSDGTCLCRYDNEKGKSDHRHIGNREEPYLFTTPEKLLQDFWNDVANYRKGLK